MLTLITSFKTYSVLIGLFLCVLQEQRVILIYSMIYYRFSIKSYAIFTEQGWYRRLVFGGWKRTPSSPVPTTNDASLESSQRELSIHIITNKIVQTSKKKEAIRFLPPISQRGPHKSWRSRRDISFRGAYCVSVRRPAQVKCNLGGHLQEHTNHRYLSLVSSVHNTQI